ncbi:acetyl-CoA carboxylase biotin carboxylase subunit family protein [Kitasatospora sp. NPDC059973]|uniref:ATP-grasp domain-containing protein n=1 Tax=Kitasatospora sp. NPDC059973 TaxID=3347020 RepID=UPI0036C6BBAD
MNVVLLGAEQEAIEELARLGHTVTVLYVAHDRVVMEACRDLIAHRAFLPSFDRPELAWAALIHLGVADQVDVVVSGHEFAVTTAAILNDILGCRKPMDARVALAGRDKPLQKTLWQRHGVPTARFVVFPERPTSVAGFRDALGDLAPPYIVKPTADGGAHLVFRAETAEELFDRLTATPELDAFMVEEWQAGDEWHFDGVVVDGRIEIFMVSRDVNPCIEAKNGNPFRSIALPPKAYPELYEEARAFAERCRSALGGRNTVFHLEVFGGPGRFVAGELAWRPAGGLVSISAQHTVGVSLWAAHALVHIDAPVPAPAFEPTGVMGFVCLPVKSGFRNGVTQEDLESLPGVRHVRMKAPVGEVMKELKTTSIAVAWALVEGDDVDHCAKRMDEAIRLVTELHEAKSLP